MPGPEAPGPEAPEPFTLRTDPADLDDLRARLRATRWPDVPDGLGWTQGVNVGELRDLVTHWAEHFDWTAQEAALNTLSHFRILLQGSRIHYVHAAAATEAAAPAAAASTTTTTDGGVPPPALPLVLCHGWPDSFWRYVKVIPLLTDPGSHGGDPADAFEVVVPDMPGFGYSDRPTGLAPDSIAVAGLWAELMTRLGHERFGVAGGDIGSGVARFLALDHPDRVVAVHRMDAGIPVAGAQSGDLGPDERAFFDAAAAWSAGEGAYAAMHRTRAQTAAVGLTDSPAGLAAWVVEKMRAWSDGGGDLGRSFTKDEILTNLTIYWLTETIGSSMRMNHANAALPPAQLARRVEVPSGFALFPGDLLRPPRSWLDRSTALASVTEPPRGGHFAPVEEPELYAQQLRDFFRPFRAAAL
ncbi:MAG: epoxide hydrolase family protein [Humibacillus sp.]